MSDNQYSNNSDNNSSGSSSNGGLSLVARFRILLPFNIVSTISTFIVLFHIFINRRARTNIKNHIFIILLIFGLTVQLIDVPLYLNFIVHGAVVPATPVTCLTWKFVDTGLYIGLICLMGWMAFERHIIVFHERLLATRKRRIIIHYIPISIIILYYVIYYMYVLMFYPCENSYDYTSVYCGYSVCYTNNINLKTWDTIVNNVIPPLLEPLMTLSFLFRVIWHKHRSHQPMHWRKHRKMAIQLFALSIPNFFINFPVDVLLIAQLCGIPSNLGDNMLAYFYFLSYFVIFIFSFICLVSFIDIKKIVQEKIVGRRSVATVAPTRIALRPTTYGAT
ncbi:unnamed protein product [Rotaria magnacalcarata]